MTTTQTQPQRLKPPPSRLVIIGWSLWLLATWWLTIGSGHATSAIRAMLFGSTTGMALLWPAWRLAQDDQPARINPTFAITPADVFVEWASMALLFQAVIIPLRMTARWTLHQTIWLDAAFLAWTLLAAGIVAWGARRNNHKRRSLAMLLCALLLFGEPALLAITANLAPTLAAWNLITSPLQVIWNLSVPPAAYNHQPPTTHILAATTAALFTWTLATRPQPTNPHNEPRP